MNKKIRMPFKMIMMPTYGNEAKLGYENGKGVMDRINIIESMDQKVQ